MTTAEQIFATMRELTKERIGTPAVHGLRVSRDVFNYMRASFVAGEVDQPLGEMLPVTVDDYLPAGSCIPCGADGMPIETAKTDVPAWARGRLPK
jgi:hypothetical protein